MSTNQVYEIDGNNFETLEGFYDEISKVLIPSAKWGKNLNAFNDILSGGFGTPETGFILKWLNSAKSKEDLGFSETVRQLEMRLEKCHPSNISYVQGELEAAQNRQGSTVFDWLVEIIQLHGEGGEESEDNVQLVLE